MHVVVIVLGDLGRSPRMQYHAQSLLKDGHTVSLVGYDGEDLIPALQENSNKDSATNNDDFAGRLNVIRFSVPSPNVFKKFLPFYLLWRISSLCVYLMYALMVSVRTKSNNQRVDCVLVQNPPAMPLLAIVYIYCRYMALTKGYRPAFIIDWHNLGFTMLSSTPIFSKVARLYEQFMAPLATAHLCVTNSMKTFLVQQFGISERRIHVLHDCSNSMFRPQTTQNNHEVLSRLHEQLCAGCPKSWYQHLDSNTQTLFTEQTANGEYSPRANRPALVTSSTSWTPDEDFGQLLDSLIGLDKDISIRSLSLKILVIVTGKGPQKSHFQKEISKLKLNHIAVQTIWLEPADYPRLLACADVGVSLHTSTSGIDLPMKILDLFGCEVPVCARDFPCLPELVQDDVNGRIFETSSELQEQLLGLLSPLGTSSGPWPPHGFGDLARYSRALEGRMKWDENWEKNALPTIESAVATTRK